MKVFELTHAGSWLEGVSDPAASFEMQSLLHLLETCITDAAVSLALFEATSHAPFPSHDPRKWERERNQESEIRVRLESELPTDLPMHKGREARTRIDEAARVAAKRARWESGEIPSSYSHRLPFIHAKTFLYALDSLQKSLGILAKKPDAPAGVAAALVEFQQAFPQLRDLRDSTHHVEDRVQGRRFGKPISLQPIDNALINAPGGALAIDALIDNRFGATLGDGSFGEVEVSAQSAAVATAIVQTVLDCFSWSGQPSHSPN